MLANQQNDNVFAKENDELKRKMTTLEKELQKAQVFIFSTRNSLVLLGKHGFFEEKL